MEKIQETGREYDPNSWNFEDFLKYWCNLKLSARDLTSNCTAVSLSDIMFYNNIERNL